MPAPRVTAIVPTYNEERRIGDCLDSLLQQRGVGEIEIIVVDGMSSDHTLDVIRSFPEFGTQIRIIDNPRRFQVYAWNAGCAAASGEYVAMISAHSVYGPNHFRTCLDVLRRTGAAAVGPVQVAEGDGQLGRAIAWCMSTPFGIGNARFRFTQEEEEVDSVFSMVLPRATFERLGGFDERIAFDEDSEFSYRLRAAGGRIVVAPTTQVRYFVRNSLRGLARQMMCYGYWRRFTQALHPREVPLRVYAPPALVAALVLSLLLAATPLRPVAWIAPLAYLSFVATAVASALRTIGLRSAACVPIALACMHLWYGLGFWRALLWPGRRLLLGQLRRSTAH